MECLYRRKTKQRTICCVHLLDGIVSKFSIGWGDEGQVLLDHVFNQLDLLERGYFGIRIMDNSTKHSFWLDPDKRILLQLKRNGVELNNAMFYLNVKFYPTQPCDLREELTRYQFFLQLKRDVLSGRLPVPFSTLARLSALAVQCELGDHEAHIGTDYLSELRLAPNQPEELKQVIARIHREELRGLTPAECEYKYLDTAKDQEFYGVEFRDVIGAENVEYRISPSPHGVLVYRGKARINLYHWQRIEKLNFKRKVFVLHVRDNGGPDVRTFTFVSATKDQCKELWRSCVEHHTFFRLAATCPTNSQLLQLGSRYRYSGRTEKEMMTDFVSRPQPEVRRRPSLTKDAQARQNHGGRTMTSETQTTQYVSPETRSANTARVFPNADIRAPTDDHRRSGYVAVKPSNSIRSNGSAGASRKHSRSRHHSNNMTRHLNSLFPSGDTSGQSQNSRSNSYVTRKENSRTPSAQRNFPRQYENIVYTDKGDPMILSSHTQVNHKSMTTDPNRSAPAIGSVSHYTTNNRHHRPQRSYSYRNQSHIPYMSFYEDKLLNRDSGTDSPTGQMTKEDDPTLFAIIKQLTPSQNLSVSDDIMSPEMINVTTSSAKHLRGYLTSHKSSIV